jgi:galactitol-specific phosphotransferase system IIB component
MALTAFEKGKLKIAAHIREELDRAGIRFESIHCKSGGIQTHRDTARLIVTVDGKAEHIDLNAPEVEECESIVAGDTWRKIAGFIERFKSA